MDENEFDETQISVDESVVEEVLAPENKTTEKVEKVEKVEKAEKQEVPAVKSIGAPPSTSGLAVSGNATDDVLLSQCVYKNIYARKSLSVHHVQRRLVEWGYRDGGSDKDGWYGDLTKDAVAAFQKARGIEGTGIMNADTLVALFDGDQNVNLIINV